MPSTPRQSARTIRERERERRLIEQQRVQELEHQASIERQRHQIFLQCISEFENSMLKLEEIVCYNCLKKTDNFDIENDLCSTCRRSRIDLFSPDNNMDLGDIPPELSELTMVEEILIARVHPVVSVFTIRGQQRGYNGHVLNFVQHVEQIADRLPHNPRNISSVLLINRETPNGLIQFKVRAQKVRNALIWLKRNNQYYRNIIIDEQVLMSLPADGDIVDMLPNMQMDIDPSHAHGPNEDLSDRANIFESSCYPNLPNIDQREAISHNLTNRNSQASQQPIDAGNWPDLSQNPENEFGVEGLICRAFPKLFPYGVGDLNSPRLYTIPKHKYFKYLMQYHDGRFAKDTRFMYYAYNSLARWAAIAYGNVFIRHREMQGHLVEDLIEMANDPNQDVANSIMYYGQSLRGTRSFWKARCAELLQMVRQVGTPTIFFTLSAADYHWPDLFRILSPETPPNHLDENERRILMNENPATVAWFFNERCEQFMKLVMMRLFGVKEFWFRFEWQHRGSPHIHGLLWLSDAPDCDDIDSLDDEAKRLIVRYFEPLIKATIRNRSMIPPRDNPCRTRFRDLNEIQKAADLDRILSAVQIHSRCGAHCLRRRIHSRAMECRYGFPKQLEEESRLSLEGAHWHFIPRRNDVYLQRYNAFISQAWRGNTDFSPVTSKDAVLSYISKYASKGEVHSEAYAEVFRNVLNRTTTDSTASTAVRKLLISSVAERNYSAQEIVHLLMSWPLYHASRSFVVLSLKEDWQRYGETNKGLMHYYSRRSTQSENMRTISLLGFAKRYRVSDRVFVERRKEVIVRIVPWISLSDDGADNEPYYKNQCILHIPWVNNPESLLADGQTWQDCYISQINRAEQNDPYPNEIPVEPDDFEFDDQHLENDLGIVRDAAMVASRLQPNMADNDPLGFRPIDEAHLWNNFESFRMNKAEIEVFLSTYKTMENPQVVEHHVLSYEQLNQNQKYVFRYLEHQIQNPDTSRKRMIVQGKAGTGKSALIKAMCSRLDDEYGELALGKTYEILAPTGAAAINIDGKTYHSALRMPINGPLVPLNGEVLRNFQLQFRGVKWIIIDEYSMIGLRQLFKIHSRLCEAKGREDLPFGGLNIYLFGDLRQLPPVMDKPIYGDPMQDVLANRGKSLFNSFTDCSILEVCHRQNQDQVDFIRMLDNLATGLVTRADWDLLMSRRSEIITNPEYFEDSVHLFPSNAQVTQFNTHKLSRNGQPVAIIEAGHNIHTIQ